MQGPAVHGSKQLAHRTAPRHDRPAHRSSEDLRGHDCTEVEQRAGRGRAVDAVDTGSVARFDGAAAVHAGIDSIWGNAPADDDLGSVRWVVDQTEKEGRYGFVVERTANKIEIKNAVEKEFGVTVTGVRTMIVPGKDRTRYTKTVILSGSTSSYKKAIITLKKGEVIDLYSAI